ncbi:hypothetical protein [Shewanella vaxholmensis]|uniref:hypothetical protein n=1 Tax=Shewanella vaxholmensis TaxID=3063535 RepID=UPI00288ECD87|nr:hypothetical protein [Shewanella sp. SP1S1-4]MDT3309704.1 hypothetical protein [Shewanella sp. SP1S1-4]
MAKLNLSQAAKIVGRNRTTLWRHINNGKLSIERDRDGNPLVDTSELLRVYGEMKLDATLEQEEKHHNETPSYDELFQLVQEMKKEQSEMRLLILELSNRLEYKSEKPADTIESVTNSNPELDPEWPKEVQTFADITLRNEIKAKYLKN